MSATWAEIACIVPTAMADDLAAYIAELSGNGVTVDNRVVDTFSLETLEDPPEKTIKGYFVVDGSLDVHLAEISSYICREAPGFPGFVPSPPNVTIIGEEDWANDWKQHFQPTRVGGRLVLKPTWESFTAAPDDIVIELDPGMAFGTGTHATTRLCLEMLDGIFLKRPPFIMPDLEPPSDILDVGTGSGILAIAAAKCGAQRVTAIDIDPRAVAVAAENVALNGVSEVVHTSAAALESLDDRYQVILANILAEELVRLSKVLLQRLAPGGFLILSGILAEREEYVIQGFAPLPLKLVEVGSEDEWRSLCFQQVG